LPHACAFAAGESKAAAGVKRPLQVMAARSSAVNHENIFIAKIRDSESARRRFRVSKRLTIAAGAHPAYRVCIQETAAAQGFPAILTNVDADRSGVSRIAISTHRIVIGDNAARALTSLRQHFLKWDAAFFDVLVYSG
jgi:2-methylcitrate dehydratase PrpD